MMRKVLVLVGCFMMLSATASAQTQPTMVLQPDHGTADRSFRATFTLKEPTCPVGQPIDFRWNPHGTELGSAPLGEHENACTATLNATPPAEHRTPDTYTVCGTYAPSEQQSRSACFDYTVDPGSAAAGGTPSPGSSPGAGGTGGGTGAGPGGGTGGGHGAAATTSPGAQPTAHATTGAEGGAGHEGEAAGSTSPKNGAVATYIGLALMLLVAIFAMREGMQGQSGH